MKKMFKKEYLKKITWWASSVIIIFLFFAFLLPVFTLQGCAGDVVSRRQGQAVGNISDDKDSQDGDGRTSPGEIPQSDKGNSQEGGQLKGENNYPDNLNDAGEEQYEFLSEEELLKFKPNELGEVMVLMYHQIGNPESEWVRTPENFKKDLLNLYRNGYRLVSLLDYVRGNINVEAGKSPVILTFDDSTLNHLNFIETDDGYEIDPDCAVAILEDFCNSHPDFGRGATFYIYYPIPFRQPQYIKDKLEFLVCRGYEIGNHTYSHADLSLHSDEDIVKEIALNAMEVGKTIEGYEVRSLALPYGSYPVNIDILAKGEYMGYSYTNEAVLLIGSTPSPSPFSTDFNPLAIPRIRASEIKVEGQGLYDWLDYFDACPGKRYISDGNSSIITAPRELMDKINNKATPKEGSV